MTDKALTIREPLGARAQLRRLEQAIRSELGSLSTGVEPLLDKVRADVGALHPEPGGTRLAPQDQEARQTELLGALDELEDVLEALQLAARSGRTARGAARGRE